MNKKIAIIEKNELKNEVPGNKKYIKFLDENRKKAVFYNPLIAPKYLNDYIKNNGIIEGYEITDYDMLKKYLNNIYTFSYDKGVYNVSRGNIDENKLLLFLNNGIELEFDVPKYNYNINNDLIYVKPYKKSINDKFCYILNEYEVNEAIKDIMLPVKEVLSGILYIDDEYKFKTKKKI